MLNPLMTVGGVYDHQREVTSDKRVFILTRSGFWGNNVMVQMYGVVMSLPHGRVLEIRFLPD